MTGPFVNISGKRNKDTRRFAESASNRAGVAAGGRQTLQQMLLQALQDPTGNAEQFQGFFEDAARAGSAAPLRDFQDILQKSQANVAGRFGGNVSSEELRVVDRGSDLFSRNLTEALAQIGPQAVAAGQQQTNFTLGARRLLGQEELDIQSLLLQAIQGEKKESNFFGRAVGAVAGGIGGFALGGPPGAVGGAQVGQGLFQ